VREIFYDKVYIRWRFMTVSSSSSPGETSSPSKRFD
jgi:hypothetical protein